MIKIRAFLIVVFLFLLPNTLSFCGVGLYENGEGKCKLCHNSCLQCHGPNNYDCIICNNSLINCTFPGTTISQCLEKCSEKDVSSLILIYSTPTTAVENEDSNLNIQTIVIWLILAATILIGCLIIIWLCIYKAWKRRKIPKDEGEAFLQNGNQLQQVIVENELPTEGIITEHLLWDNKEFLASGQYGDVYKCLYRKNNNQYFYVAVKVANDKAPDAFEEREHMARLKHPHIIGLVATMIDQNVILVTPLRRNNLKNFIHETNGLTITHKIRYCQQIANGMSYLMLKRIVHCDLKATNILVVNENWIEISDFGLARRMNHQRTGGTMGTITHTAIELFKDYKGNNAQNSEATEIWSFGVVMWEIFDTTNKLPYQIEVHPLTEIPLFEFLKKNGALSTTNWPQDISQTLSTLMFRCWNRNPLLRYSFKKLWISFSSMLPESLDFYNILTQTENHNSTNGSSQIVNSVAHPENFSSSFHF